MTFKEKFFYLFSDLLYIEKLQVVFTLFSEDRKLKTIICADYVFQKNAERLVKDEFSAKQKYCNDIEKKNHEKIKKRAKKLLKEKKEEKWIHNKGQVFPSTQLMGAEWDVYIVKTRTPTFEEWKEHHEHT